MQTYHGRCHCGAISFQFSGEPITQGLRCNCSLCVRKGALMSSAIYAPEQLHIQAAEGVLGCYQFGSAVAKHYFCRTCGIYPFHQTLRMPGHYRVNLGCVDGVDSLALPSQVFDGKAL